MTEQIMQTNEQIQTPDNSALVKGLLGTKIGMTRVYVDEAEMIPVTIISTEGVVITQVKTTQDNGYDAIQVGYGDLVDRKLSKAELGHLKKNGVALKRHLREFRVKDTSIFKVGQNVSPSVFQKGDWLQVSGYSKGGGYAGVIKRHGFAGLPHSHGNGEYRRHPGSSGAQGPQHVLPGTRKPGRKGYLWSTIPKIEVVDVDVTKNLILVRGSVPGPNGNLLVLKATSRYVSPVQPVKAATSKSKAKK
ncbi:MAG: 50S ribosomal protein L3 [Elusimicrobiota bacterium]